ncbi:MAG: tetratricopeptide repeat protein [Nitrospira sp.]|nr:tetratricopeptide repeat protein [Nitrospira sp.]
MNRTERRRQAKLTAKSPTSSSTVFAKQLFEEAINHHRAGRLSQAETCYRQILTQDPTHADALHLLGLVAYQQARYERALDCISKAVQRDATKPLYFYNLGLVHQKLNQLHEAERSYRQALSLKGDYVEALGNLGNVLREKGELDEACATYQQVLRIKTDHAEGYNNLGVVLKEQGKKDEARDAYQRAIALNPENAEAHYNLGVILFECERLDEAITRFEQAASIKPHYAKAHHHMGLAKLWKQDMDGALHELRTSAHLLQNHGRFVPIVTLYASRIKHDAEQIQYLAERGLLVQSDTRYQATLTALRERVSGEENQRIHLSQEEARALAPSVNRILHYADNPVLPQGALNPELDVEEIEQRYNASHPEIIYIDALLRPAALEALRQFCLESTIWKKDYEDGYIGAFLGEGFSSPLLLQVAEELRTTFPGIFRQHRLLQAWAFKQDSARRPLKIHADAAVVNVNFWITPDDANLDPASGGLIVWDKDAPQEWDFKIYNSTAFQPKIREFLKQSGASPVKVPYRANRALVFNSDLFHESDTCTFRDEYVSRRINITFLYGRRR